VTVALGEYLDAVPNLVAERIAGAQQALIVSHENPDADTLGAALGVARIIEYHGGHATTVCTDPVPPLYTFLPGIEAERTELDPATSYDLLVVVDCGTFERVGEIGRRHAELFERLPRVIIDHHLSNSGSSTPAADWVDPGSAATCEMVVLLAARLGVPLGVANGALAAALMAGIVMDTSTFAHSNVTPRTLQVAAALVEVGAPLAEISRRLYRTKPDNQLRLFGRVLGRLEAADGGRVVWSSLLDADLAATGTSPADSEGIIDLVAQAEDAEVAIIFKEAAGETRISVRTRPDGVDATVLTGAFGGGGHARASGATIQQPLDAARTAVLAEARRLAAAVIR
jgi:bifunctional oligoribonuclease and PAP phosphatase NrnA